MHEAMAGAFDTIIEQIRPIQIDAPSAGATVKRPRWPMIVFDSPKGWTGPKVIDGKANEGTFRSHQVPLSDPAKNPEHLRLLQIRLRSHCSDGLFDQQCRL